MKLNGTPLKRFYIRHEEIISGGVLEMKMGPEPVENSKLKAILKKSNSLIMEDIRFKKNRKNRKSEIIKVGLIAILSIVMLVFGIYNKSIFTIIVFAGLLILGLYLIYNSIKNKNTVTINEKGISSNTNGMGLIKWEYIEDFEIQNAVNAKVLVVKINDFEKLLFEMNTISKQLMKTNIKKLGSPVIIPASEFNESLENVKMMIEKYRNSL